MVVLIMRHPVSRRAWLLGLSTILMGSAGASARVRKQNAQVVNISVERFSFTPSEFRVKAGAPVEIRLQSDDTDHGFRIVGTDINVRIPKRGKGVATVTFHPPTAGRYVFECSRLCGAGHSFMRGAIIAE
jgi:cytochrome c oxidase subunit 2